MNRFLFLSVLLFSSICSAESYYWSYSYAPGTKFPSAVAACTYAVGTNAGFIYTSTTIIVNGASVTADCYAQSKTSGKISKYTSVLRSGNGCGSGEVYNAQTGQCVLPAYPDGTVCTDESVPPPRVYQAGTCITLGTATKETKCKYYATGGTSNTTPRIYWLYEGKGDFSEQLTGKDASGCETKVLNPDLKKDCKYTPEMKFPPQPGAGEGGSDLPGYTQPGTYKCKFSATLTGNVSPDGGSAEPTDKICTDPGSPRCALIDLPKDVETKPCNYTTAADGSQVCASSTKETKPGSTSCGYVGSTWTCKDDLPNAVGKGITIATKVKTESTPDGKTKVTKTDTLFETICKGTPAACSSSTSTSVSTTIKNGSGQTESVTGSCTGPHCPDKNTNPDGNGDGFGDCVGDECTGQGGGEFGVPELEETPTFGESTKKFTDGMQNIPLVTSIKGIRAPSGACPTFTADTDLLGPVVYDGHCAVVDANRDLITLIAKAIWSFIAVMILLG